MQLTPLQLEIQQRVDKTLNFGVIVECGRREYYGSGKSGNYKSLGLYKLVSGKEKFDTKIVVLVDGEPNWIDGQLQFEDKEFDCCYIITDNETTHRYLFDDGVDYKILKIVGHPMNWGRLCYLYLRHRNYEGTKEKFDELKAMFGFSNHIYIQQTVLERPVELQELVLAFLKTLGPL